VILGFDKSTLYGAKFDERDYSGVVVVTMKEHDDDNKEA
jgi:hypothetical protein